MGEQRVDPRFIVQLANRKTGEVKDYPTYPGVLDLAHRLGLQSLMTKVTQAPTAENGYEAIVEATAMFGERGERVFQDYGDASPKNTSERMATALIRIASTRAKGRALRDATNVGQTLLEELPDTEEYAEPKQGPRPVPAPATVPTGRAPQPQQASKPVLCVLCQGGLLDGRRRDCEKNPNPQTGEIIYSHASCESKAKAGAK